MDLNQVTLPSIDVPTSMAFYARLGLRLVVDSAPRYVRFALPTGRATLSLHEAASVTQPTGVVIYFESASAAELDARCADLAGDGIVFDQLPRDEAWGWREARLRDPDGHVVCLYFAGSYRHDPPWKV